DSKYGSARSSAEVRARCARDIADVANFRQLDNRNQPTEGSVAATPTPFTSGSNPDLKPETSTSRTLGVVWSPSFISNFNVS
ncbi:TonB-dependent receptor, partial [Pseudomonas ogarae]|uniref:TonB-dependent receptor n=1 Tax=Pseudomonas ogarae (strain DSM 112162 / CECT 30235 / F113) TaxID=1114970 RepID=UPI0019519689